MWWFTIGLVLDQVLRLLILATRPAWVHDGSRWFGVITQPVSSWIALAIFAVLLWRLPYRGTWLAFAGAVSNLVTFYAAGRAVDYLPLGNISTNFADILICGGLAWAAWEYLHKKNAP